MREYFQIDNIQSNTWPKFTYLESGKAKTRVFDSENNGAFIQSANAALSLPMSCFAMKEGRHQSTCHGQLQVTEIQLYVALAKRGI